MKKNGFTLIELLAVITVLSLVMLIAVPSVNKLIDNSSEKAYISSTRKIEGIAKNYVVTHPELLKQDYFEVSTNLLCSEKLIACPIIDSRDDSEIIGKVIVEYNSSTNSYSYTFSRN